MRGVVCEYKPNCVITRARTLGARAVAGRPVRTAFVGVFAAALLAFLGLGAVLPVLPRYVKGPIGAGDLAVGVVTGAFALTAVLCRPVAGRVADARGRRMVVVVGALFAALAGVLYFVPAGVPGLLVARYTATMAWVLLIVMSVLFTFYLKAFRRAPARVE